MSSIYPEKFASLRTNTSATRWSSITQHRAPHKPFLLLAVLDMIAQGAITSNFIELNAELMDTFDLYWLKVMPSDTEGNPVLPFFHLISDGFWSLKAVPGMETALSATRQIRSISQLEQLVMGATLDESLFRSMQNEQTRDELRRVLIETYFEPSVRPALVEAGAISHQSFEYSREIQKKAHTKFVLEDAPTVEDRYFTESRSMAFRQVIVRVYEFTCAVCRIRIVTPEGRAAVSAAHIVPWSHSHNDDPRNGLALCGLHHWAFDQGMLAVDDDYRVQISPVITLDEPGTGAMLELSNRGLRVPSDEAYLPSKRALQWHWHNQYRSIPVRRMV